MRRRRRDNTLNLFAFQDIITGVAGVMLFILLLLVVQMTLRPATASTMFADALGTNAPPPPPPNRPSPDDARQLQQLQSELEDLRQQAKKMLRADEGDLDAEIQAAEAELEQLMSDAAEQKSQAEAMKTEIAAQDTSEQKTTTIQKRNALKRKLEELEQEQSRHAGGKLIAFKSPSSGTKELWIIDMRGTITSIFNVESPADAVRVSYDHFEPPAMIVHKIRSALEERTKIRSVVVLLRPTISGTGSEILDAFRFSGFNVALELLDEDTQVVPPSKEMDSDDTSAKTPRQGAGK